jgi:hypothetical protein
VFARTRWETRPALRTEQLFESLARLAQEGKINAKEMPNPLQLAVLANAYREEFRTTKAPQPLQAAVLPVMSAIGKVFGYRA